MAASPNLVGSLRLWFRQFLDLRVGTIGPTLRGRERVTYIRRQKSLQLFSFFFVRDARSSWTECSALQLLVSHSAYCRGGSEPLSTLAENKSHTLLDMGHLKVPIETYAGTALSYNAHP